MKKRYRKTAALLLAGILSLGSVLQVGATDTQIDAAQKEKEQLEQQKQAAEQDVYKRQRLTSVSICNFLARL